MSAFCTRIAPTPSGFLHEGNGTSFALTQLLANRHHGGILRLRIDDLDRGRFRPEYLADIFETLAWMGIDQFAGPQNAADFLNDHSQHHRLNRYSELLTQLVSTGRVYACDCSRRQVRERTGGGLLYDGFCRNRRLPLDQSNVNWRIHVPSDTTIRNFSLAERTADFVVRKRDGLPAYQIGSVADDVDFGITYVVRGADLLDSTLAQLYLAQLLQLTAFEQITFFHHPLLTDTGNEKLSKSAGATALRTWRAAGRPPTGLYDRARRWLAGEDNIVL